MNKYQGIDTMYHSLTRRHNPDVQALKVATLRRRSLKAGWIPISKKAETDNATACYLTERKGSWDTPSSARPTE